MADEVKVPPPGMTMIVNVALEEFEKAVYSRDYEQATVLLLQNLRKFKAGGQFIGYVPDPALNKILYTRFCAAVISLLADSRYGLSNDGFDNLAAEHAIMDLLFRASAFGTSDHLLPLMSANPGADARQLKIENGAGVAKFLLTYSLISGFALNFEQTLSKAPQSLLSLYAGMLSPLLTVNPQAHDAREALLGMHRIFENCDLTEAVLPTLADAYMYTSYGTRADKHDAKATIHALFAKMLQPLVPTPQAQPHKERPTILICLDWFNSNHAMYRCYAPIIRQLRKRFRLVAMSIPGSIDDKGKAEFDEWRPVKQERLALADLAAEIIEHVKPDIVYYPSIGMALWWVALASIRLAPVQVMTMGHPASSRSAAIDYVICEEGAIGDPSLYTEQILTMPVGTGRFEMRADADLPEPHRDDAPEVVKIAVPSMLCKLNAPFMAALKAIKEQAPRPVEFHFFVNMLGVQLSQSASEIREWVPGARIYERRHYNQYMRELRECHLHLSTFPFGGTNSNIDSMLMGLPIICLEGQDHHERFDAMMIRRAGLPESLIAKNAQEYVAEAVRLIGDDAARNALRDHLLAFDLEGEFFGDPPQDAFLKAMESAYERQFH